MDKHEWICEDCGEIITFRQPERQQDDYNSEQNEDKTCPNCGCDMWFDVIGGEEMEEEVFATTTVFMEPTDDFVCQIMKIAGIRTVVDVGAGMGRFELVAKSLGYNNVISIDMFPGSNHVMCHDANAFPFTSRMLPIFIRPCHGGWVQDLMERYSDTIPQWLYVSMPENFIHDLPLGRCHMDILDDWKGPEGEKIVSIKMREIPKTIETSA